MKSVLISIQPKWCELIASGKKTVEVRRTKPKIDVPFKCYIYCTNGKEKLWVLKETERAFTPAKIASICAAKDVGGTYQANGKVIGEFVCDEIIRINYSCGSYRCEGFNRRENDRIASGSQLSLYDMRNYLSCNGGYAWHISDLVIYDKPKELREFRSYNVRSYIGENGYPMPTHEITRPPQSWCYVERSKS